MALFCDGAKVTGSVLLSEGFEAEGVVRFAGAEIGGDLACTGGRFKTAKAAPLADKTEPARAAVALSLSSAKIGGTLWLGPASPPNHQHVTLEGSLDLQGAHAQELIDSRELWQVKEVVTDQGALPCYLHLDGFTYDRFAGVAKTDWLTRKAWLERQRPSHLAEEFRPQPFEQLVKVLRGMGARRRCAPDRDAQAFPAAEAEEVWEGSPSPGRSARYGGCPAAMATAPGWPVTLVDAVARLRFSVSAGRGAWRLRAEGCAGLDQRDL